MISKISLVLLIIFSLTYVVYLEYGSENKIATSSALSLQEIISPETLAKEVEDVEKHLLALQKPLSKEQAKIYENLLKQLKYNVTSHPLKMSWPDFYSYVEKKEIDDYGKVCNILAKLKYSKELSIQEADHVFNLLKEERKLLNNFFKKKYLTRLKNGDRVSNEESSKIIDELKEKRQFIRKNFDEQYQKILPEKTTRDWVFLHLRNSFSMVFSSLGNVDGGVGVPERYFHLLSSEDLANE